MSLLPAPDAVHSSEAATQGPPNVLGRIGGKCYDHRRAVLVGWIVGVIAIIAVASTIGSRFENNFGGVGQSQQAQTLLDQRFPTQAGDNAQVVFRSVPTIDAPDVTRRVDSALAAIRTLPSVT